MTWWQNATAVNGSPACVPAWVTVGYVGSGTGEHTFPGQLAAQGCREPSAAWVTLDPRISRSRQRKTLRDSGEAGSGALVLNAGLHHVLMHDYTSQHSNAMWPGTETEGETRNLSTPSFSFITGSFGFVFWSISSDLIFFLSLQKKKIYLELDLNKNIHQLFILMGAVDVLGFPLMFLVDVLGFPTK